MSSKAVTAAGPAVHPFGYEEISAFDGIPGTSPTAAAQAESARLREQQLLEQARREGMVRAQASFEEQLAGERECLVQALAEFIKQRDSYFLAVESEVVQLALAIARKILHREAQVDALLLAGMVRVALEKLQANTEVAVRVHPQHAAEWRDYFAKHLELCDLLEVIEDPSLDVHRCVLQTVLGTTELGIESQLKEVEQGLFDLMAQRPTSRS
jgi:flagellar assembly protein FliH